MRILPLNILAISSRVPAAEKKGDQVISYFRLTYLARMGHSIELICFGDMHREEDRHARQTLEAAGVVVHFVRWKPWEAACNLLNALLRSGAPFQCALYKSKQFSNTINEVTHKLKPDALYCVMVRVAENAKTFKGKMFVEMVDSMGLNFARRVALSNYMVRWLLNIERRRVSEYEKTLADRAERSFVVSNIDRNAIDSEKIDVIPLGIDMQRFLKIRESSDVPVIAFTGNMNYQPNVDATCWFVENCWASIKQSVLGVRLVIAGNEPQARVVSLATHDPAIIVTGRVPSIAKILNAATIAIAPMQSGSGMQFKILEAMACGIPVVASTLGLGDIQAIAGKDLLVGDSPEDFINSTLQLLRSPELREQIGNAGFNYVREHHTWHALNSYFERCLIVGLNKGIER